METEGMIVDEKKEGEIKETMVKSCLISFGLLVDAQMFQHVQVGTKKVINMVSLSFQFFICNNLDQSGK